MRFVPNILTVFRLILAPIFLSVFFSVTENRFVWALCIFVLAGLTDLLDGYLARKYDAMSIFGTIMDPFADKLMLLVALGAMSHEGLIHPAFFWIILIKEFLMMLAGCVMYFSKEKMVVPANKCGKCATVVFAVAVATNLLWPNNWLSEGIMIVAATTALIAFLSYADNAIRLKAKTKDRV